eukprot:TRINITY_DN2926_c0_g1_i2.p1 TRINITY_DN2926_c0_g1~~TRINITY_DN2926_c0_g1_i2.p1  ORF type:complete len:584 (+),score=114.63 TRINITY_DN2926_c0_g1_i2:110-1861(+)
MQPVRERSRLLCTLSVLVVTSLDVRPSLAEFCQLPGCGSGGFDEDAAVMLQGVRHPQHRQATPQSREALPLAPRGAAALLGMKSSSKISQGENLAEHVEDGEAGAQLSNATSSLGETNKSEKSLSSGDTDTSHDMGSQQKASSARAPSEHHGVSTLQQRHSEEDHHAFSADSQAQTQDSLTASSSGMTDAEGEAGELRQQNYRQVESSIEHVRKVLLFQLSSIAETAKHLAAPGDTLPSVLPFLAVLSVVFASCLACCYAFNTPRALEQRSSRPSNLQGAPRSSLAGPWPSRPQTMRDSLPPGSAVPNSLKDPYNAYMSAASSRPKNSLLPVNQLTGKSLAPPSARTTPAPSLPLLQSRPGTALTANGNGHAEWNAGGAEAAEELPPPLYPALVLPAREAQMEIPVDVLLEGREHGASSFFVLGPLGNKIMHVTFCGNAFDVHMAPPSSELVANVALTEAADRSRLEICGPDGTVYGHILENQQMGRSVGQSSFSVVVRSLSGQAGREMLLINGSPEQLRLTATAAENGQPVASAARQTKRNGQNLDIRTQRGADVALVLSCFLAVLLLQPHPRLRASKGGQR